MANKFSKEEANLVFNNATQKLIKDAFKHTCCISVASYYTQVSLHLWCTHVLKLLIFYFDILLSA